MKIGYALAFVAALMSSCGEDSTGDMLSQVHTYRGNNILAQKIGDVTYTLVSGVSQESVLGIYPEKIEEDKKTKDLFEKANKARIYLGENAEELPSFDNCDIATIDDALTQGLDEIEVAYIGRNGNVWMTKKFSLESANRTNSLETYLKRAENARKISGYLPDSGWVEEDNFEFEDFGIRDPRKIPQVKTYRSRDVLMQSKDGMIFVAVENFGKYLSGAEKDREHEHFDEVFLINGEEAWKIALIYQKDTPVYGRPSWRELEKTTNQALKDFQENFETGVNRMQEAVGNAKLEEIGNGAQTETKPLDERFEKLLGCYSRKQKIEGEK